jgi:TM2 domain-containing membrane protein YozV
MGAMITNPRANPIIAVIAAWFIPGLGHIIIGQQSKGIKLLIGTLVLSFITCGMGWFLNLAWVFDAFKLAQKLASGEEISENQNALGFMDAIFKD